MFMKFIVLYRHTGAASYKYMLCALKLFFKVLSLIKPTYILIILIRGTNIIDYDWRTALKE